MNADMVMRYSVDLNAPLVPRMANTLFVSGDNMANTVEAVLTKDGKALDASGYTCVLKMNRPDGEVPEMAGQVDGNVLIVTMTSDFYAVPGNYTAKLKLINAQTGERKTVLVLYGEILDDGGMPTIVPGNKLPEDIEAMLAMMEELREATADSRTAAQEARDAGAEAVAIAQEAADTANQAAENIDEKVNEANAELAGKVGQLSEEILTKAPAINCEVSGSIATVTDAATQPAVQLISHIEPVQDSETGAISRRDIVNLNRTGKNLISINYDGTNASVNIKAENGVVTLNGTKPETASSSAITISKAVKLPADTYTLSHNIVSGSSDGWPDNSTVVAVYEGSDSIVRTRLNTTESVVFTLESEKIIALKIIRPTASVTFDNFTFTVQIERGNVATDFNPPEVQTLTAEFPETVYGGQVNWGTGEIISALDSDGNALPEPQVYQLTPQQMQMLKGTNNVWSDCGDTDLVYVADTKMYIDNAIAAIAAATVKN